jgi:cytochrome c peroxidase
MDVYRERFAKATGRDREHAVTARAVQTALASYVRSLTAYDAPFDRAIRGEAALDASARRGFNLFMGKAACGTCHFAPLFNGTVPPEFVLSEPEVIGVPAKLGPAIPKLDPDIGRGAIDRRSGFLHAFKTPTVRNAALGGPYMHNGAFRTLDEVIDFYDRGGGAGLGIDVPNQTLSSRPLHLQPGERADLIAFLRTLVDTAGLTARPASGR